MRQPRRRILSIDGGGIYGLSAALWLRKLCEADKTFLNGEDVYLFAGCSSGAVNALLLAKHERPREAVLAGELDRFWKEPGTFTNSNPTDQLLSWMQLAGWFGERDFMDLLLRYFGELTLGDLKHRVLISTFNWHGDRPVFPPLRDPSERPGATSVEEASASWQRAMKELGGLFAALRNDVPKPDPANIRRWHPEMFSNERGSRDRDFHVVDIAYGAATPPGFRALRGGIGDGATFSASPAVDAIAHVVGEERRRDELARPHAHVVRDVLSTISVLSLGDGTFSPFHFLPNSNLGFQTWGLVPSNPAEGAVWSPTAYSLQPADQQSTLIASELLGPDFFRLNPPLMNLPTVMAAYYARWPALRLAILEQIERVASGPVATAAVAAALAFIQSADWRGERDEGAK